MENHVHLLVKEGKEDIGVTLRRIGASFVYGIIGNTREAVICFKTVIKVIERNM